MSFYQANSELILSLAKLTSALLIAFAAAPFLKRPALRATFWAGVLIILPIVIMATHGRGKLNILPQPSASVSPVEIPLPQPRTSVSPSQLSLPSPSPLSQPNSERLPKPTQLASVAPPREINWVATVFLIGTAFSFLPILVSLLRIRLMSKKPAGASAMAVWETIRPKTSPAVPLYLTDSPSAPFTAGMMRAAVLLPEASDTWSPRRLRSTLHHEAAHITRRDSLVRVLASFVRAILWFHPLVWLAHRQLVAAQEEACDEIALAAGIPPDEYAEDLLETAKRSRHAFGHSLHMARWSQLGNRIQAILRKKTTQPQPISMKTIATVILGVTAVTYSLSTLGFSETPGEPKATAVTNVAEPKPQQINSEYPQRKVSDLDKEIIILETQIEALAKYQEDSLFHYASGLDLPDNTVRKLYRDYLEVKRQIDDLKVSGLGDSHPTVLSHQETLSLMKKRLEESVVNIRSRLEEQLNLTQTLAGRIAALEKTKVAVEPPEGQAYLTEKLRTIVIPVIDFEETTIEEAADFLRQRAREFDTKELDKGKKGINFVVSPPKDLTTPMPMIDELRLRNVPLGVALKYICDKTGMRYKVDEFAVTLYSPPTAEAQIVDDVSAKELIHVGGQVRKPGPVAWKKDLTLPEAVQRAGGATEFGTMKRVIVYRDGKTLTYDLTDVEAMRTTLENGDTIAVAQKNIFGQ